MRPASFYLNLIWLALAVLLGSVLFNKFTGSSIESLAIKTSTKIEEKVAAFEALPKSDKAALQNFYLQQKCGVYFFRNDSLVFWNNSRIPFQETASSFSGQSGFIALKHGSYFYYKEVLPHAEVHLLLCLIKSNYALQNNYLNNNFESWTKIPKDLKIVEVAKSDAIVRFGTQALFGLSGNESTYHTETSDFLSSLFFLLGFVFLCGALLFYASRTSDLKRKWILLPLPFVLRLILVWTKQPDFLYRSIWYDLRIFGDADSWLGAYLGDLMINSLLLLQLAVYFKSTAAHQIQSKTLKNLGLGGILLLLIINSFDHSLLSLVANSTINFDFLNVLNIQLPALTGLAVLCFYGLAFYITLQSLWQKSYLQGKKKEIQISLLLVLIGIVQYLFHPSQTLLEAFWPLVLGLGAQVILRLLNSRPQLALSVFVVLLAVLCSRLLNSYIDRNERQELQLLSYKLSERVDPVLESEFNLIPERITKDQNVRNLLNILPASAEGVSALIRQRYFGSYFDRYAVDLQLFDAACNPLFPVSDGRLNNSGYFDDVIRTRSDSTTVPGLYFVSGHQENTEYIAAIQLATYKLFARLDVKKFEEQGTFPDLLLDRSQQRDEKWKAFSHAVYRGAQLTNQYGEISYPFSLQDSAAIAITHPNFINHYYSPEPGTVVVISEKAHTLSQFFTSNSYILLYFSFLAFISYLMHAVLFAQRLRAPSLTRRIQSIVILLLLVSMSAIGYTSTRLVTAQFKTDNKRELEEKTQIILRELGSAFTQEEIFDDSRRDLINLKLKEYARLFNTPISLFDKSGKFFTTSEEKLYDLGLSARLVNPFAFEQLSNNRSSAEPVDEKAGTLTYVSFYTPVMSKNAELLGFINLPYFARQSALVTELSGIISALANVYVLLFVLSILAGLILAGYITQPLRLIQQQIAGISLGKQNEKITWNSNDEIGRLVAEYNTMLSKLEESANLLAQSERESAWREMARQVAHEIKNPLTPMKLNLQYLQHVIKNNDPEFKIKFDKSVVAIIEQIDSLANIATEFSNFARLPSGSLQDLALSEIIEASVQLFQDDRRVIIINKMDRADILVKADRDQCLRVFNNVLKNAVQALEGIDEPQIEISFQEEEDAVIIAVKDNGCGIETEQKEKIFTPNFTTKSTGSGLGLSMVKNIMEGFGGKISFESEPKSGSTFFLKFRKVSA